MSSDTALSPANARETTAALMNCGRAPTTVTILITDSGTLSALVLFDRRQEAVSLPVEIAALEAAQAVVGRGAKNRFAEILPENLSLFSPVPAAISVEDFFIRRQREFKMVFQVGFFFRRQYRPFKAPGVSTVF